MRHWGPEADLWSLGMVTYVLLSGACCSRSSAPRELDDGCSRASILQAVALTMLVLLLLQG